MDPFVDIKEVYFLNTPDSILCEIELWKIPDSLEYNNTALDTNRLEFMWALELDFGDDSDYKNNIILTMFLEKQHLSDIGTIITDLEEFFSHCAVVVMQNQGENGVKYSYNFHKSFFNNTIRLGFCKNDIGLKFKLTRIKWIVHSFHNLGKNNDRQIHNADYFTLNKEAFPHHFRYDEYKYSFKKAFNGCLEYFLQTSVGWGDQSIRWYPQSDAPLLEKIYIE